MFSVKAQLLLTADKLRDYSTTPELDARLLMTKLLDWEMYQLVTRGDEQLSPREIELLNQYILRRQAGEPMAYILGKKEFMAEEFVVTPAVLVPRPDTEILLETILNRHSEARHALDLCTGSGIIAIILLKKNPKLVMDALDISAEALNIAEFNGEKHGVMERLKLIQSDLFQSLATKNYDFIVSNPPYISSDEMDELSNTVKDYEPRIALDGGRDGLDFYRRIIHDAGAFLKQQGSLYLEIGANQGEAVRQILKENKYTNIEIIPDLAGHQRVVVGVKGAEDDR